MIITKHLSDMQVLLQKHCRKIFQFEFLNFFQVFKTLRDVRHLYADLFKDMLVVCLSIENIMYTVDFPDFVRHKMVLSVRSI